MPTPYQTLVIADGAVSYVPGNDTVSPVVDIVQSVSNSSVNIPPDLGLTIPPALGGVGLGFFRSGGPMGMQFPNPFSSPGTSTLSLELWINSTDVLPSSGLGTTCPASGMCSDVSGFGHTDWGLGFSGAMLPSFSLGLPGTGNDATLATTTPLNDGLDHHIVATWDAGTGTAIIYVDSVQVAQSAAFTALSTNGFGFWNAGLQTIESFVGTASNFALYGTALSQAQITAHYSAGTGPKAVPDVVGEIDADAQSAILAATLTVGTITIVPGGIPNTVASQSPVGGTLVATGSPVDLVEYEGVLVPDVTNTSATIVAPGIITAAGLTVGATTYAPDVLTIVGNVVSQSPAAGTLVALDTPINLVVSTGRAGLLVPLILFLTEAEAIDALVSIGLVPGGISFAPSTTFAAGEVMAQNPSAGNPIAYGGIVGFVVSTGTPIVSSLFDTGPTVISQYANSPTLLQWISNMNLYMDQSVNFAKFLAYVWNVNTAVGFGLDIWGRIVNVSRLLQIPNTTLYVGFDNGTRSPSDWEPLGSNQPGGGGIGALYSGHNATQAYLLDDDAYRQLILAKAFANICATTAPALNQILQNLYGANNAWVLNTGTMSISYNFRFRPSPVQLAILQQSGVIPTPPGVSVTIVSP